MTAATLTQAEQVACQRRAIGLMGRLLDHYSHLEPLSWTVGNASCTLTGAVSTLPPEAEIRDAFTAWSAVLGLVATPARVDQISTRLLATGRLDGVHVVLTATIYVADGS